MRAIRGFVPRVLSLLLIGGAGGCREKAAESGNFFVGVAGASAESLFQNEELGANSYRTDLPWASVEPARGRLAVPRSTLGPARSGHPAGVTPLYILAYGNRFYDSGLFPITPEGRQAFVRYARSSLGAMARAGGLWEIWNEWNLPCGMPAGIPPGRPEDYVRLLADTYSALKPLYPNQVFLGGAVAGIGRKDDWTRRALDAGILQHLDGFSFHPYVYWMPPERRPPERGMLDLVEELETLLAKYPRGAEVPLYVTELGWPTHDAPDGVTPEQQASYLSRAILLLRANPRIRGVWAYALKNGNGISFDRESHFGLMFNDGSPKPAWFAFRDTATLLARTANCRRVDFASVDDGEDLAGVELTDLRGTKSLALWTIGDGETYQLKLRVRPPAASLPAFKTNILGAGEGPLLSPLNSEAGDRTLVVTVGNQPLLIEATGPLEKIEEVEIVTSGKD